MMIAVGHFQDLLAPRQTGRRTDKCDSSDSLTPFLQSRTKTREKPHAPPMYVHTVGSVR